MFVTQDTKTRGTQQKVLSEVRVQAEPAGGEDSQKVAAGKNQNIALDTANAMHDSIGSIADLRK